MVKKEDAPPVEPTPLVPYPIHRFGELDNAAPSEAGPSGYNYIPTADSTDWEQGYLLNSGTSDFNPALNYPSLEEFDSDNYGLGSCSQFLPTLPPFLSPNYLTNGRLPYDFFNDQSAMASTSHLNPSPDFATLPEGGTDEEYRWAFNENAVQQDGLETIGGTQAYTPTSYQLPAPTATTSTRPTTTFSLKSPRNTPSPSTTTSITTTTTINPVYDPYGSTVTNQNPYAMLTALASSTPSLPPASRERTRPFSLLKRPTPLPFPQNLTTRPPKNSLASEDSSASHRNWQGLYSSSGFDLIGMLARVASRPNAQINIGPVDTKSAFVVCDANQYDQPIIFASETFKELTGYSGTEILGQNCRFLQSPDGVIVPGSPRKHMDGRASFHLKRHISAGKESQTSMINYCKGGKPFINLLTVIPISWDSDEIAYYVGFQVSLAPSAPSRFQRLP